MSSLEEQQFSSARFSVCSSIENPSSSSSSSRYSSTGSSSQSSSNGGSSEASYSSVENCIPVQEGAVHCLALSQGRLLSGSSNSRILLWGESKADAEADSDCVFSQLSKFGKGDGAVKALVAVKNGSVVFSAHQDNKIRVWKKRTDCEYKFKLSATLPTVYDVLRRCILPRNYVRVRRHRSCLWIQHSDAISCLALDEDAGVIYSCSWDRTVKVWGMRGLRCLESFKAHHDAINAVVTRDGYVYTGSADSRVKVWARKSRRKHVLVAVLCHTRMQCAVNALAFNSEGRVLYAGMSDSTIAAWEIQERAEVGEDGELGGDYHVEHMKLVARLRGHRRAVLCLGVARELLCSGSADACVRVWKHGCCLAVLKGHTCAVRCIAVAFVVDHRQQEEGFENGRVFVVHSGGLDRRIRSWRVLLEEEM